MINKLETYPWNAAEHLETKDAIATYLKATFENGDPTLVLAAPRDTACFKGMTHIKANM